MTVSRVGAGATTAAGGIDVIPPATETAPDRIQTSVPMLSDFLRPSLIVGKVFYRFSRVVFVGGETQQLVRMDATRVGLFLGHDGLSATILTAGLSDDGQIAPVLWVGGKDTRGGTLADFLSLICGAWIGTLPAAGTVYVTELIRRT